MSAVVEEWRPVVGYEGWTDVSDLGRARRWYRLERARRAWRCHMLSEPEIIPIKPGAWGRAHLALWLNGHRVMLLHRAVLLTFVSPCPEGMEACHFPDRDPLNCALENLRWDTRRANQADSTAHRTCDPAAIQTRLSLLRQRHPHLRASVEGLVFESFRSDQYTAQVDAALAQMREARSA